MQRFHRLVRDNIEHEFTLYERTAGFPPDPSVQWLASPSTDDTCAEYYTGLVQHVIIDKQGYTWIGMTQCSKQDMFNKKIGRAIAKGRAEKAYHIYRSADALDFNGTTGLPLGLKRANVKTRGFHSEIIQGIMCSRKEED